MSNTQTIAIDKERLRRMVRDVLMNFNGTAAHPMEILLALAECMGRMVCQVEGSDTAKQEMLHFAFQHLGTTIDAIQRSKSPVVIQ